MTVVLKRKMPGRRWVSCDSRCYEAKTEDCACEACNGRNHGVGVKQALANSAELEGVYEDGVKKVYQEPKPHADPRQQVIF